MATPDGPFRAHTGDRSFDLTFDEGVLKIDGEETAYEFSPVDGGYAVLNVEGRSVPVYVQAETDGTFTVSLKGTQRKVRVQDAQALLLERFGVDRGEGGASREVRAPMPGLVLRVAVEAGQEVAEGDSLVVLEAMKMENELKAQAAGTVAAVHVSAGDAVAKNAILIAFE
jgi:pyruvate carboxylase subunit B